MTSIAKTSPETNQINNPLVSVIVPVYNGERYLAAALDSIFNQDYRPIEVIVVDDGSVDGSADIICSYAEVRYIYQSNQGVAVARNVGITAACGEFIAFLDQDDLWTPNKLTGQVDYLIKDPHVGYTICQMQNFLEPGTDLPSWFPPNQLSANLSAYITSALLIRKSVLKKIGHFNPTYRHGNDTDLFFRANDAGIPMKVIPEVFLHKRIHDTNGSQEISVIRSELLRAVKSSIKRKQADHATQDK